jgi:hypothetical protein
VNSLAIRCIAILGAVFVGPSLAAQSSALVPESTAPHFDLRSLSSRPSPYREKLIAIKHSRFHLDREIKLMGVFQAAAETIDGYSTWQFTHTRLYYSEGDPFSKFFIGERATPWRMGLFGATEALGAAYLSQYMRHSHHKFVRVVSYGIQPTLAALHLYAGVSNLTSDFSLCNPGEGYNGIACVPKNKRGFGHGSW